ncbi:MAG: helix-turn-helix transcriptional regulator [Victivallales bacterium]|nr:helix-turn-helix transcriptional regulator [Victivallales bacterium]
MCRLEVLHCGFERFRKADARQKRYPLSSQHIHPVFHLLLFSEGSFEYLHNDRRQPFSPGVFTVTNPGEPHRFGSCPCDGHCAYFFLTFHLTDLETGEAHFLNLSKLLSMLAGEPVLLPDFPIKFNKRKAAVFENLVLMLTGQLKSSSRLGAFSAARTIIDILDFVMRECPGNTEDSFGDIPKDIPLEKAKRHIERNFTRKLTVKELASVASLEPSYFIRKFKRFYGSPPVAFQIELKINAAKNLLSTGGYSVAETAERTGFKDIYYFSRIFRKVTGKTPTSLKPKFSSGKGGS